jgi:hypothetical protein
MLQNKKNCALNMFLLATFQFIVFHNTKDNLLLKKAHLDPKLTL